jgi:hypothetical protein
VSRRAYNHPEERRGCNQYTRQGSQLPVSNRLPDSHHVEGRRHASTDLPTTGRRGAVPCRIGTPTNPATECSRELEPVQLRALRCSILTTLFSVGARGFADEAKPRPFGRAADKAPRTSCRRAAGETLSRRSLRTTPCRFGALTGADGRWFQREFGRVTLTSSSQQQWALSLTLTLFGAHSRAERPARTAPK